MSTPENPEDPERTPRLIESLYPEYYQHELTEEEKDREALLCCHVDRRGRRCDRQKIENDTLCIKHGGSMTLAKESAQRRLLELQERSMRIANEMFDFGDDRVKTTVMLAVWDRTGLTPRAAFGQPSSEADSTLTNEEIATRLEEQAKKLRAEGKEKDAAKFRVETQAEQEKKRDDDSDADASTDKIH
jgi:hypothetical protein